MRALIARLRMRRAAHNFESYLAALGRVVLAGGVARDHERW